MGEGEGHAPVDGTAKAGADEPESDGAGPRHRADQVSLEFGNGDYCIGDERQVADLLPLRRH